VVFSSLIFIFGFLPFTLLLYYFSPNIKVKNYVLTFLSILFYAWGEPVWVILLLISSIVDFVNGKIIARHLGQWKARVALIASIFFNLGFLITFKYTGFFIDNLNLIPGVHLPGWEIALPIGISFYTFQTLSYTIDVYRGKVEAQQSFMDFLLFVSLFPQLVAGPILRYVDVAEQIKFRKTTLQGFSTGVTRFVIGLAKKVLIANYAGNIARLLLDGNLADLSVLEAWLGIILFSFQIYFDFSGYSDMAIGLGHMFGFNYKENFNYPYTSTSITDFWRRWHISLSSFFRDYVYIPLGGNKKRMFLNILIVWLLTGFWHGASWNFILWGLYFAVLLIIEKVFLLELFKRLPKFVPHIYALFFIVVGWVFFYFTDLNTMGTFFKCLFGLNGLPLVTEKGLTLLTNNSLLLVLASLASLPISKYIKIYFDNNMLVNPLTSTRRQAFSGIAVIVFNSIVFLISTIALVGSSYNPFIYFRY